MSDHPDASRRSLNFLDQFLADGQIIDDALDEATTVIQSTIEGLQKEASDHRKNPRRYIKRPREEAHQKLVDDYFAENPLYPSHLFRRRFRMSKPLFQRIVDALGQWSEYFTQRVDAVNRQGLSPLQKCTAAIRQLATGSAADQLDDYLKIGETTAMEALKNFVKGVREIFGERYLRRPTMEDTERLLKLGERRGFPGMFGSIDCMHWQWERCPVAWKGQFTRGDQKVPTLILEAVASHDLWIWHAFFGAAGSNNDINVLNQSTVFINELKGQAPRVQYMVNGNQHNIGYFLADGIYPEWAVFVKSIRLPITEKEKLYAQEQEGARKDIERAFGVLQRRWCILKRPARLYDRAVLRDVVLACIILHNMIVEDEKDQDIIEENLDLNMPPSSSTVQEPEFSPEQDIPLARTLEKDTSIRDKTTHRRLKNDLIEHIWNKFGGHARRTGV
ncbi:putative nuclease HARBI1 [Sorghum bicolor]|uniref:putative nuclease HARBI1 n=1 Tax=Sorghum bicolor TaxID=4558 RepID=UPI000B424646|nr:putative nuclease HARBI1 [Sorghum bicolor]|eukprot:XP_002449057.2 putative nuclease HARBI1 [Sorghum bicolor]